MKCEHCKKNLERVNPKAEDYLENLLCFEVFGWKFMLFRDDATYGCISCIIDEQQQRERDMMRDAVAGMISLEIDRGNLIMKD